MTSQYTTFTFDSYTCTPETGECEFVYLMKGEKEDTLEFREKIMFPKEWDADRLPKHLTEKLFQSIHIILGVSYYKTYCPEHISVPYVLSKKEAEFWSTIYHKGLGEFAFHNDISLDAIARFSGDDSVIHKKPVSISVRNRALVGIGGGKDSAVMLELLKDEVEQVGFVVEKERSYEAVDDVARVADAPLIRVRRIIDEKLYEPSFNKYKGHIPVSAIYAFLGYATAILSNYRFVVVGNEQSSNDGNVMHGDEMVNHQWSKSVEFEELFQDYTRTFLSPSVTYFSLLRPFHEVRIAKMFVEKCGTYIDSFVSCNKYFSSAYDHKKKWCGECAKCSSVFLALAPFMERERLEGIFEKNLFNDKKLVSMFRDLLGLGEMKPFDCVGTFEESRQVFLLAAEKYADTVIVKALRDEVATLPAIQKDVFRPVQALTIPPRFRFTGMESVVLLGYGKEGRATESYLKVRYSACTIGIADKSENDKYLEKQYDYDIAVRTPGLPKSQVHVQYTTATNMFFAEAEKVGCEIIGVTGSKGKSTTVSLMKHIFDCAGKKAVLAGNIGVPLLEIAEHGLDTDTLYIAELSSYQLDDIAYSPHVAVVTNLFPDHMDYHGGEDAYYEAKKNIMRYQESDDVFLFNASTSLLKEWASESLGKGVSFSLGDGEGYATNLRGEHNTGNIAAAVAVARMYDITEDVIERAIADFTPLPHRLEHVGTFRDIDFYDDAISTTPESTIAALKSIPHAETIFLGGHDRGYDFTELADFLLHTDVKNIVLFSGMKDVIDRSKFNIVETHSMEEAVRFAYETTSPGKACLLSTASPSHGLWKNFEEKGDSFQQYVRHHGA